ncbi:hypothetical protein RND71_008822 [Anisodus tanguticus]|uniref:Uncharacterized protein n=1 Tax=Anisodus tanguticus TaxID=243964 RepID=A0AAE1SLJ2_9SOLA|nr:hypothetical protein RND71_008822 [Anisodus tanguticus]
MGQVQSDAIDNQSQIADDSQSPSLDSLIAVLVVIAHLRGGPCGNQFSDAFLCFLKSTAEEKGSDCVSPFVALQSCIKANPNAFSKDVLEDDDDDDDDDVRKQDEVQKEETPKQEYRIIPPIWSVESQGH